DIIITVTYSRVLRSQLLCCYGNWIPVRLSCLSGPYKRELPFGGDNFCRVGYLTTKSSVGCASDMQQTSKRSSPASARRRTGGSRHRNSRDVVREARMGIPLCHAACKLRPAAYGGAGPHLKTVVWCSALDQCLEERSRVALNTLLQVVSYER